MVDEIKRAEQQEKEVINLIYDIEKDSPSYKLQELLSEMSEDEIRELLKKYNML